MLHIGVRSFQFDRTTKFKDITEDWLKTWVLPVFEIDYVRESVEGFRNDTVILNTPNYLPRIDSSIIYALIGVVTILVIFIIIGIYYFIKKREQANNQDDYDDTREADTKYDEFEYNYAYQTVDYTNEEIDGIYQAHNHEYLVLSDAMAENMENNEKMTETYQA